MKLLLLALLCAHVCWAVGFGKTAKQNTGGSDATPRQSVFSSLWRSSTQAVQSALTHAKKLVRRAPPTPPAKSSTWDAHKETQLKQWIAKDAEEFRKRMHEARLVS